jgi:hypothetical protein
VAALVLLCLQPIGHVHNDLIVRSKRRRGKRIAAEQHRDRGRDQHCRRSHGASFNFLMGQLFERASCNYWKTAVLRRGSEVLEQKMHAQFQLIFADPPKRGRSAPRRKNFPAGDPFEYRLNVGRSSGV